MNRATRKRCNEKRTIVVQPEWQDGTLPALLGVASSRDLRKHHIEATYALLPEAMWCADLGPYLIDMRPAELRAAYARISLMGPSLRDTWRGLFR